MKKPTEDIFMRFLQGCCSEEELIMVKSWVDSSEDNASELFHMKRAYQRMQIAAISDEQTEQALNKMLDKCHVEEETLTPFYRIGWLKYAAVLVITLLVGAGIMYKA